MDQILEHAIEGLDEMLNSLTGLASISEGQEQGLEALGGLGLQNIGTPQLEQSIMR
jgi:hypothetical protein